MGKYWVVVAWCWGKGVHSDLQFAFREERNVMEAVFILGEKAILSPPPFLSISPNHITFPFSPITTTTITSYSHSLPVICVFFIHCNPISICSPPTLSWHIDVLLLQPSQILVMMPLNAIKSLQLIWRSCTRRYLLGYPTFKFIVVAQLVWGYHNISPNNCDQKICHCD